MNDPEHKYEERLSEMMRQSHFGNLQQDGTLKKDEGIQLVSHQCIDLNDESDYDSFDENEDALDKILEEAIASSEDDNNSIIECLKNNVKVYLSDNDRDYAIQRNINGKYCDIGSRINIEVNHFPLVINIDEVYLYYVVVKLMDTRSEQEINCNTGKQTSINWIRNREVMEEARNKISLFKNSYFIYDGNLKMYTNKMLPFRNRIEFNINFQPSDCEESLIYSIFLIKSERFIIDLTPIRDFYARKIQKIPVEAITAIETILRHAPSMKFTRKNRNFFHQDAQKIPISGGLEAWTGHHQSIAIGENALFLNIDEVKKVFYPSIPILLFVSKILNKNEFNFSDFRYLKDSLKGIKVERRIEDEIMYSSIDAISNFDSKRARFKDDNFDGTVYEYYERFYNIKLAYPHLPCAEIKKKGNLYLCPLEFLHLQSGQAYPKKLTPNQNSEIIRVSAIKPHDRFQNIKNTFDELNKMWEPIKLHFKIEIVPNFQRIFARRIEAPTLVAQNNGWNAHDSCVDVKNGSWSMKFKKFENPVILEHWLVINFCPRLRDSDSFIRKIREYAIKLGLKIKNHAGSYAVNPKFELTNQISAITKRYTDLQIIVCIINDDVDQPLIKRFSKETLNIETQCVRDRNVYKILKSPSYDILMNLCLSLNQKIGGTNTCLLEALKPKVLDSPTLIMGADVNHAAPGSTRPSVASIVGSIHDNLSNYKVVRREQPARSEIINDLGNMTKTLLEAFKDEYTCYPERIIFFRDGVGRGQYKEIKEKELKMLKEACDSINEKTISITLVIVTKRHNVRFCLLNTGRDNNRRDFNSREPNQNIPPGTIIDQYLCHPYAYEFYLCSHFTLNGTAKPSKYSVLLDENDLTSSELQTLVFYLCHTYAHCTKSISLPAPIKYAHKDAYHGCN